MQGLGGHSGQGGLGGRMDRVVETCKMSPNYDKDDDEVRPDQPCGW